MNMYTLGLWLWLFWGRGPAQVFGVTVTFKETGEMVTVKGDQEADGVQEVPGVPGSNYNVSTFTMNVTIVDAQDMDMLNRPLSVLEDGKTKEKVSVMSSWILFHMRGNHTDSLKQPALPKLVGGLRAAVADALEVCRSSVGIVDMRAINIDVIDKLDFQEEKPSDKDDQSSESATLLEHAAKLMRNMKATEKEKSHVNVTQIKAVYEVRIFKEMKVSDSEVGRRVDNFQIYSKFADLNRMLGRSLSQAFGNSMEGVMLDDVGYASRHQLLRPPLSADEVKDCSAEVSLHDARQIHQFIVAMSLIMVALITCAGSTVFTIKHASSVPSRFNPLVQNGQ